MTKNNLSGFVRAAEFIKKRGLSEKYWQKEAEIIKITNQKSKVLNESVSMSTDTFYKKYYE